MVFRACCSGVHGNSRIHRTSEVMAPRCTAPRLDSDTRNLFWFARNNTWMGLMTACSKNAHGAGLCLYTSLGTHRLLRVEGGQAWARGDEGRAISLMGRRIERSGKTGEKRSVERSRHMCECERVRKRRDGASTPSRITQKNKLEGIMLQAPSLLGGSALAKSA